MPRKILDPIERKLDDLKGEMKGSMQVKDIDEAKELNEYLEDQLDLCLDLGVVIHRRHGKCALCVPLKKDKYIYIESVIKKYNSSTPENREIAVENLLHDIKREAVDMWM